ncbi:MAG: hypothetical protein Q9227_009340 [Pyrenula ochraceoflavens]
MIEVENEPTSKIDRNGEKKLVNQSGGHAEAPDGCVGCMCDDVVIGAGGPCTLEIWIVNAFDEMERNNLLAELQTSDRRVSLLRASGEVKKPDQCAVVGAPHVPSDPDCMDYEISRAFDASQRECDGKVDLYPQGDHVLCLEMLYLSGGQANGIARIVDFPCLSFPSQESGVDRNNPLGVTGGFCACRIFRLDVDEEEELVICVVAQFCCDLAHEMKVGRDSLPQLSSCLSSVDCVRSSPCTNRRHLSGGRVVANQEAQGWCLKSRQRRCDGSLAVSFEGKRYTRDTESWGGQCERHNDKG